MLYLKHLLNILFWSGTALAWLPAAKTLLKCRIIAHNKQPQSLSSRSNNNNNSDHVDTIQLAGLGNDHEQVGAALGASVARWLDAEWMPQDIHRQIGESCATTYAATRAQGTDCLMTIMTQIADDLSADWYEKYDADAFVNAWDIANYVSDYLVQQAGNESCECSSQIH